MIVKFLGKITCVICHILQKPFLTVIIHFLLHPFCSYKAMLALLSLHTDDSLEKTFAARPSITPKITIRAVRKYERDVMIFVFSLVLSISVLFSMSFPLFGNIEKNLNLYLFFILQLFYK